MDSIFPFGFPAPTAGYLSLYVATFALHQLFMHYVLAGTLYISWTSVFPGEGTPRGERPLAAVIREWLPFLLSAAITAGVAPLLFVQIVYPRHFYTANLLLAWRWMIVVPVLIVAFYLLYVLKSKIFTRASPAVRTMVTLATAACFVFVGFCWTANHLLGNAEARWPEIYTTGEFHFRVSQVLVRMLIWTGGSFASLAVFTAWQLRIRANRHPDEVARIALLGIGGTLVALGSAAAYLFLLDDATRSRLFGNPGWPYLLLGILGAALQLFGWWKVRTSRAIGLQPLILASVGLTCSLIGCAVVREVLRLHHIDIASLYAHHAEASQVGGLSVFLVFTVVNAGLIAYCIWLVRPQRKAA